MVGGDASRAEQVIIGYYCMFVVTTRVKALMTAIGGLTIDNLCIGEVIKD